MSITHFVAVLLVAYMALGALLRVGSIGQERKPISPVVGAISLVIDAALILGVVYLAGWIGR